VRRFDDDEYDFVKSGPVRHLLQEDPDLPETGDNWSSWDAAQHGPTPWPAWVRTEHRATDTELGILKTGKEADVFLVRRELPDDPAATSLLAAKRYRTSEHRNFHRDAGYLEGRRVRRSRENRAMSNRTGFGKELIAGQWAAAEFGALSQLWLIGEESGLVRVPFPVQLIGTELMLEFIGDWETGEAAPRLAQLRPDPDVLADLWRQMVDALSVLARAQVAHGDLSPYNTLVHDGRLVLIDLPQIVDVVANPAGAEFIARDVRNVAAWFTARGQELDADELIERLLYEAGLR
jgi:RIO kinase 1